MRYKCKQLRKLREDSGQTLRHVAFALSMNPSRLSRIETCKYSCNDLDMKDFARFYGVSVDYLLEYCDNKFISDSDFEKFMYIVPLKISKICPERISDEDFLQDCYLDLLEYIQESKSFNNPKNNGIKTTLVHTHIAWFINNTLKKDESNYKNVAGLYFTRKDFSDIEKLVCQNSLTEIIYSLFDTLTEREADVLESIYFYNQNYTAIGTRLGCTRERIRQIENKAIRKLRHPSRAKKIRDFYC